MSRRGRFAERQTPAGNHKLPKDSANEPTPKAFVGFIGCDVGKSHVIVFDSRSGRTVSLPNQPAPLADWAARIEPGYLVVCEAIGGYEAALLAAASAAGLPAHRADARKVKAFIRSFGTLGKTDAIDARALTGYGRERHAELALWRPSDAECDRLHALVTTRADLVAARHACHNRLAAPGAGMCGRICNLSQRADRRNRGRPRRASADARGSTNPARHRRHRARARGDLARFDARTRTPQSTPSRSPRRARSASKAKQSV